MVYLLYALLAVAAFLIVLNGFLRGAKKAQIDALLSVAGISLLVAVTVIGGWMSGLAGIVLVFVFAVASRPFAARLASRLYAIGSGQGGHSPSLPPAPLRRISQDLGRPLDPGSFMQSLAARDDPRQRARDALYAYCEASPAVHAVMDDFGVTRTELDELYWQLMAVGAGQWARGHWVAASALGYPETLRYVLEGRRRGRELPDLTFAVGMYFERGAPLNSY